MIKTEQLKKLRETAQFKIHWNYLGWKDEMGMYYHTQKEWNSTLVTKITQISAHLFQHTDRRGAHSVYAGPKAFEILVAYEHFNPIISGVYGVISNRNVYLVNQSPTDEVLVLNDEVCGLITIENLK